MSLVVNAVKGHTNRSASHVRDKIREILPSGAHFNSTSAIIGIALVIPISAALNHATPGPIFRPSIPMTRRAMPEISSAEGIPLFLQAPATANETGIQTPSSDYFAFSAITFTYPPSSLSITSRLRDDNQPTKAFALKVKQTYLRILSWQHSR